MAKQLPSGSWRTQVSTGVKRPDGKGYYKESFTAPTPEEADFLALQYKMAKNKTAKKQASQKSRNKGMTFLEACEKYISENETLLSPSTISGYKKITKNEKRLSSLKPKKLRTLTQEDIQKEVNRESGFLAPKTVRNDHGFVSIVLKEYRPDLHLDTKLPQKEKYIPNIPDVDDVKKILKLIEDTPLELPVLMAVVLGFRLSEIRGLRWQDVNFKKKTLTVRRALVDTISGPVLKTTKTVSGTRLLPLPDILITILEKYKPDELDAPITELSGAAIYKRFTRLLESNGMEHYRFHDLRHANATIMLLLGVPDKYAMKRLGHATPDMLKRVYQHTLQSYDEEINQTINQYFDALADEE